MWLLGVLLLSWSRSCASCNLEPWLLKEEHTDTGYHVLCALKTTVAVYRKGVSLREGQQPEHVGLDKDLAASLEDLLDLKDELKFLPFQQPDGQGQWNGGRITWKQQSWALFTENGTRITPGKAILNLEGYSGVLLLFAGGVWRWPTVQVGFERPVLPGVTLRTLAMRPALFELVFEGDQVKDGLSQSLLDGVVQLAKPRLKRSLTEAKASHIRTSNQAWFDYDETPGLSRLQDLTQELLHIPKTYFESNLQVLRYGKGQLYDAHRDYWDPKEFPDEQRFLHPSNKLWYNRHATVLWFLKPSETGGETWFPRARGGPIPWGEWTACDDRGLKISGRNKTIAILFYSLQSDGDIDDFSWHCGCPVGEGIKWSANTWVWNQDGSAKARHIKKRRAKRRATQAKDTKDQGAL